MNETLRKSAADGYVLQIRKIGNSTGIILPKDLLARMNLKDGDKLHVVDQTKDGMRLTPYDPRHARMMEIARGVMDEYKDTFHELAK